MDDAQLIRRYVEEGAEAAFSELVRRHLSLVHSAAMRQVSGDFHRAKDVAQMVFTLLARKASSLTQHTSLTGWLYTTTYFVATRLRRAERRRKVREEENYHMNELLADREPEVDWNQLRPVLDGAMLELNERDREAILWRFFEALPLEDMGEKMGINASGAKKRVDRALEKMRLSLGKRGAESTTAALALMLADHAVTAAPAGLAESLTTTALAATAASSSASALGFLHFFSAAKIVTGTAAVAGLLAIGAGVHELRVAQRAESSLAVANREYQGQWDRLQALTQEERTGNRNRQDILKALGGLRTIAAQAGDAHPGAKKFPADSPEARDLFRTAETATLELKYRRFYKSADLTAAEIRQFEDVVIRAEEENSVQTPAGVIYTHRPEALRQVQGQLLEIFGAQREQQFEAYNQSLPALSVPGSIATAVDYVGLPLTDDQIDQLQRAVIDQGAGGPVDWAAVSAKARGILSAPQWRTAEAGLLGRQFNDLLRRAPPSQPAAANPG